ncbi:hypothetical protein ACI2OX_16940 [Bacillus sp. N9]
MNEIIMMIQDLFDFNYEKVREYFSTLFFTIIFTYFMIIIFRTILKQIFKHTSIIEEKRKKRLKVSLRIHHAIFLRRSY